MSVHWPISEQALRAAVRAYRQRAAKCEDSKKGECRGIEDAIREYLNIEGFELTQNDCYGMFGRRSGQPLRIMERIMGPVREVRPRRRVGDDPDDTTEYIVP